MWQVSGRSNITDFEEVVKLDKQYISEWTMGLDMVEDEEGFEYPQINENKMSVKVLRSNDTWYGMTYKEDVASVKDSFHQMLEKDVYKADLFSDL